MRIYFIIFSFIVCTIYVSCTKSGFDKNQILTTVTLKIKLVSGNGQTDTVGNPLANPIAVQVTANDVPLAGYSVQFKGSGCNQDIISPDVSHKNGMVNYTWSLAGDVGQQTLTAYVLNSDNQRADSVEVKATAIAGGTGWHNAGCTLQTGLSPAAFCKLSTGRLFTSFAGGKASLRYSDDNGANWYAVASLGSSHQINYVVANAADEVYALTTDGVFYSKDAGQNWTNAGAAPFDSATINAATATPGGKLMITTSEPAAAYVSADKGKTWTTAAKTAFPEAQPIEPYFNCPTEDKDGNLYVTDTSNQNLFKSPDGGVTWYQYAPGTVVSFYIDNTNLFYAGFTNLHPGAGLLVSDDKGVGYTADMLGGENFGNLSVQSDGKLYYENNSNGLYVFNSYNNSTLIFPFKNTGLQPYIVANNNNMIVANWGKPYIRYYSK